MRLPPLLPLLSTSDWAVGQVSTYSELGTATCNPVRQSAHAAAHLSAIESCQLTVRDLSNPTWRSAMRRCRRAASVLMLARCAARSLMKASTCCGDSRAECTTCGGIYKGAFSP